MKERGGSLYLITPPTEDVVTLDEAKAYLRITNVDFDDLIQTMIDASVSALDPASSGWLGRALRPQTWEYRLPGFGPYQVYDSYYHRLMEPEFHYRRHRHLNYIELPYPPLISIDSVKYDDGNGVEQTLIEDVDFRVIGVGGIKRAHIEPLYNQTWPSSVRYDEEAVRVKFTAGYSETNDKMPGAIKQAVLLMVRSLYDVSARNLFISSESVEGVGSRSYVVTENGANLMRNISENLLQNLRVY